MQVATGHFNFPLQRLVHGDPVAGVGQGIAQGTTGGGPIEQGIAHRIKQGRQQGLQMTLFLVAETLIAPKHQLAHGFAFMAQAVADGVVAALAELQAQVAGLVLVNQGIEGHKALGFAKEQAENALRFQAGL